MKFRPPSYVGAFVALVAASLGISIFPDLHGASTPKVKEAIPSGESASPSSEKKPPTEQFRRLLKMSPSQRQSELASKDQEKRDYILSKLKEYESLPENEREVRLKQLELRWYLLPLLKMAPSNRVERLSAIPPESQKLLADRLIQWDLLPPVLQKEFLEHEGTVAYFIRLEAKTPEEQSEVWQSVPVDKRAPLEKALSEWHTLPEERRQGMYSRVHQFFELNDREKERTLATLPGADRQDMDKALANFQKLPVEKRVAAIESFQKLSQLSPEGRAQFLKNAEHWAGMSPEDRQMWRDLVSKVPAMPPLPPGFQIMPPVPGLAAQK
ncbi:MAG: hypothetical protein JWM04_216 [Verrucomicrobiales bacterium]|nr:hypothetical protein [Verrucomicrobiales bacterium]